MNAQALFERTLRVASDTCLVVGNGPSLRDIPIAFLKKYPSFGTNRIYLLEGFTPTFYVCVNPLVVGQYADEIAAMPCRAKFITASHADRIPDAMPLYSSFVPTFSRKPHERVYEGYTVTYVCLQLAFWMGFRRVLLVGVDHSYKFDGVPNEARILEGPDPNHFSPEYFRGARWNNPDLAQSELSYAMAKTVFESEGREIINCTPGTALDIFPKADWRKYV